MKYYKISEEEVKRIDQLIDYGAVDLIDIRDQITEIPELTDEMIDEMAIKKFPFDLSIVPLPSGQAKDYNDGMRKRFIEIWKAAREFYTKNK